MCKIIDGFPLEASKLTKVFSAASLYYNFSGTEKRFNIENATNAHGLSGWDWQVSDIHLRTFRHTCVHGVHLTVQGNTLIRKRILHLGKATIDFHFLYPYWLWRPIRYESM